MKENVPTDTTTTITIWGAPFSEKNKVHCVLFVPILDNFWLVAAQGIYLKYHTSYQWEFQDPKMEVLYHIRPYFGDISPYKAQKHRRFSYGRSLQSSLVPGQHGH